jgi:hypothetical protein
LREFLSYVLSRQGRFDEAAVVSRSGVEAWRASGSKGKGLVHGANLAEGLLRGGRVEEARDTLDAHLELARRTKARHRVAQNLRVRGLLLAREGRGSEALSALDEAVVDLEACESRMQLVHALADRARLLREAGRDADADVDVTRAKTILDRCGASDRILAV